MDHLQSFIADCDRRTEVAKKRLAETQEEISAEVAAKVRVLILSAVQNAGSVPYAVCLHYGTDWQEIAKTYIKILGTFLLVYPNTNILYNCSTVSEN
jgi:hypothetical protein